MDREVYYRKIASYVQALPDKQLDAIYTIIKSMSTNDVRNIIEKGNNSKIRYYLNFETLTTLILGFSNHIIDNLRTLNNLGTMTIVVYPNDVNMYGIKVMKKFLSMHLDNELLNAIVFSRSIPAQLDKTLVLDNVITYNSQILLDFINKV